MNKKILSFLLTFAMIFSMAAAFAGTVSADDVVDLTDGIDHYADLEAFVASLTTETYTGETITLNADITVNEGWVANDGTSAAVAEPTGDTAKILDTAAETQYFKGTFEGNNHTISGLYMNGRAFFDATSGATIQNVTFDNCAVKVSTGNVQTGIVIGEHVAGTLTLNNVVVKNSKVTNHTELAANLSAFIGKITKTTTATITDCKAINCGLYSAVTAAVTVYAGGIVGNCGATSATSIKLLRCSSDTDIIIDAGLNYEDNRSRQRCGGMIGNNTGTNIEITECVNTGDLTAQTHVGGMVAYTEKALTLDECVNYGKIIGNNIVTTNVPNASNGTGAAGIQVAAGGLIGEIKVTGCSISNSINYGTVSATNLYAIDYTSSTSSTRWNHGGVPCAAGGLVGSGSATKAYKVTISNCLNQGDISANEYAFARAGGAMGESIGELDITNFVNTGKIAGYQRAGGVLGYYNGTNGTVEKVISVGVIEGYSRSENVSAMWSGAAFGQWENQNGTSEVNFIDFFYTNPNAYKTVIGMNQSSSSAVANHTVAYTDGESLDFEPTVTNAEATTQAANLQKYSEFFIANGYLGTTYGDIANALKAFNIGVDWMMTDPVPVPASVFALMDDKEFVEEEVDFVGYQMGVGTNVNAIRLIAGLDSLDYSNTGFALTIVAKDVDEEKMYAEQRTTKVYTSLNVYDAEGNPLTPYYASNVGYTYLSAITLTGLDTLAEGVTTLIVKPFVTVSGVPQYGSACAVVINKTGNTLTVTDQYVM